MWDYKSATSLSLVQCVFCACLTTLGTKYIGGHHQLFSMLQSQVNVSNASDPGTKNLELTMGSQHLRT